MDTVNYDRGSVTLQDVALAEMRMPVFREEPLAIVRELYEEQDMMEPPCPIIRSVITLSLIFLPEPSREPSAM